MQEIERGASLFDNPAPYVHGEVGVEAGQALRRWDLNVPMARSIALFLYSWGSTS